MISSTLQTTRGNDAEAKSIEKVHSRRTRRISYQFRKTQLNNQQLGLQFLNKEHIVFCRIPTIPVPKNTADIHF